MNVEPEPPRLIIGISGSIESSIRFHFHPLPDITAYELAQCIPYINTQAFRSSYERLPESAKRHLLIPDTNCVYL